MSKNPLSDIYTKNVLLNEEKDNVVTPTSKQEIAKGGKVHLTKDSGDVKAKKDLETPEVNKEYTDVSKTKKVEEDMNTENTYEGAFEKLFKATITEDVVEDTVEEVEVPTTDEEAVDEITGDTDEVNDLVSDLKAVIKHLESILSKVSEVEHEAEEEDELSEEEPFEEAVEAEDLGHSLVNAKSGKDLVGPKGHGEVKGAVKVTKGKVNDGDITSEPETKELHADTKDLQNTKKQSVKTSNIKVGDFFK